MSAPGRAAWPDHPWERSSATRGAFHDVAVLDRAVARVDTRPGAEGRATRESRALRALEHVQLPLDVPRLLDGPVVADGTAGVLVSFVGGQRRPHATWNEVRSGLASLLEMLWDCRPYSDGGPLPPVRAWCGGERWAAVVTENLAPRLPDGVAAAAELRGDESLRDHALGNVERRLAAGTLHDPDGWR